MNDIVKKPNVFIIGAPKCGTTSMCEYLKAHPEVYFSNPKELHFYNDDFKRKLGFNYKSYLKYFNNVSITDKVICEGSVYYLYSKTAVHNILNDCPKAKFIVMLRNPIQMLPSLHMESVHSHGENILEFEQAWNLQESRKKGLNIPKLNFYPQALFYGEMAKLGEQVDSLLKTVDKQQVHFILFDDFKKNVKFEYSKTLEFLGLNSWYPLQFDVKNASKGYKLMFIKKVLDYIPYIKRKLGIQGGTGLGSLLNKINYKVHVRKEIHPDLKKELQEFYYNDVIKLSQLLDRDLLREWDFIK